VHKADKTRVCRGVVETNGVPKAGFERTPCSIIIVSKGKCNAILHGDANQPARRGSRSEGRLEIPEVFLNLSGTNNRDAAQGIILEFHSQAAHGDLEDLCRVRPIALALRQCFQDVIEFDIRKGLQIFVKSHAAAPSLTKISLADITRLRG